MRTPRTFGPSLSGRSPSRPIASSGSPPRPISHRFAAPGNTEPLISRRQEGDLEIDAVGSHPQDLALYDGDVIGALEGDRVVAGAVATRAAAHAHALEANVVARALAAVEADLRAQDLHVVEQHPFDERRL